MEQRTRRCGVRLSRWSSVCAFVLVCGALSAAAAQTRSPIILTDATSTRAIALDSISRTRDPFRVNTVSFVAGADTRTRVLFFVMNLDLLPSEGANALTADGEDETHRLYKFKVENVDPVPGFEGMQQVIIRLSDDIGDVGDILLRLNLHGVASNRVRISVGHTGGTLQDDPGSVPSPAPATPPAPTPTPTPNPYTGAASDADTVRFLEQAAWGPTSAEVTRIKAMGFNVYLNEQFNLAATGYPNMALVPTDNSVGCPQTDQTQRNLCLRDNYTMYPLQKQFFTNAMYGPDQLRQRVAFALHKIIVVSGSDINITSWYNPYLQAINNNAFGNFRTLLTDITLNPAMGEYLNMRGNTRTNPNENYAREILQLFSVGLDQLNQDGTPILDAQGNRVPTYDQTTITEFARVFTGWNLAPLNPPQSGVANYISPMVVANENNHDRNAKTLLQYSGAISSLPANQTSAQDLNAALNNIFNHPNVGPFIGRQLIQQLVTSNPSPAYVGRVAAAFNNNGLGVRGDMQAVIRAIVLDPEARGDAKTDPNYGHLREPVQFVGNMLRAFNATAFNNTAVNSDGVISSRDNLGFTSMDQNLFLPPTVFSYFPADYNVPGTALTGPEFGILSATTALKRANYANGLVYTGITVNADRPNGTSLNLSAIQALADNPTQLVDTLNTLLLHNSMSASVRTSITTAVAAIPTSTSQYQLKRAQAAIYLAVTSAQYQVQR
ncbi:MAG: DUF1800 family protein [Pyrinomonadaceae bacterium]